eukprot:CAMPEP_0172358756 /NCGR_PEP_ID=MMETSP1060-20121228/3045_1 /TAXON_ID=37318 /ORGANISM="Pseudo-nitzschia pungens, Strain cf. cingulata" /LENGTH=1709 /DNA_ID=CAMNT_0013080105 /DNA_START=280 /DNA_END=5409 /DNA_ORIENTATION=+
MLRVDTNYRDEGETEDQRNSNSSANLSAVSNIQLTSPTYGIHPHQSPTDLHKNSNKNKNKNKNKRQQSPLGRTYYSSTAVSVASQEYSAHTRSGHSRGSRTTRGSNDSNRMVVSSFSSLATQSIGQGKYQQAIEYYRLALQDYTRDSTQTTIVELVNAAATCFNLGALAKKLREYSRAAEYFTQAQDMYLQSRTVIETYVRSGGASGPLSPSASSVSSSSVSTYSSHVCLLQLIVETLQARAHLHYKYQSLVDEAVECHEEVVELLEENNATIDIPSNRRSSRLPPLEHDVVYHRIHFTILSQHVRWQLLVTSLQALGKLYMEKGELEDAIVAYQDTLSILQKLNGHENESTLQRQEEILQILRALSEFYMQNHFDSNDVTKLERAAILHEDLENWEKALQCWERILHCQSKEYGNESFEVSVALGQLARVMVLEENLEGALDLYQATANLSLKVNQKKKTNTGASSKSKDVVFSIPEETFLGILDIYNELARIPDAIGWLKGLLSKSERREDQGRIQLELGKLYLHQGRIDDASDALCLSLELFDGEDESAFELLRKVQYLGERGEDGDVDEERAQHVGVASTNSRDLAGGRDLGEDCLSAITEDGESDFLTEGTSVFESLGAALSGAGDDKLVDQNGDDESEDLSLLMANADNENGENVDHQQLNSKSNVSPNKLENNNEDQQTSHEFIDEKKEEEIGQRSLVEGVHKNNDPIDSEQKQFSLGYTFPSGEESISSIDGSPSKQLKSTSVEANRGNETYPETIDDPDLAIASSNSTSNDEVEPIGPSQNDADKIEVKNAQSDIDSIKKVEEMEQRTQQLSPLGSQESPIITQKETGESNDTPVSKSSANSRTALLKPTGKPAMDGSINLPNIASPPKHPTNEKASRGRRGYKEMNKSEKQPAKTGKNRIVKALSNPFRRSRSKSRSAAGNPLVPLDEDKEVRQSMPTKKPQKENIDNGSCNSKEAPISYIDFRNNSDDDRSLVSQLTFREYELLSKKKEQQSEDGNWWWGGRAEGFEGWFPSNYVHQAVEAAEGFLSAKAIHDKVKSRPLDFDSDEESEEPEDEDSLLKDSFSKESKTERKGDNSNKVKSTKHLEISSQSRNQSFGSSGAQDANESNPESNKTPSLETRIHEKKLQIEGLRKKNGQEDIEVAMLLFDLAELYIKRKASADAMLYCRQAFRIQKSTLHLPEACKSLSFMADVHCREGRYKEALSCYYEARQILESLYGYFDEEIAKNLNQCGNVLAHKGEFDLAMDKHKEALSILKECCGENVKNPLVSDTLIQIGAVYYKERNSLANIQSKQNDGYKTFIEGGMLEVIGRAHEDRGSYRIAIAFFEEKLHFLNNVDNSNNLEDIAETLNSLGMLRCRAGMYLEAIDNYDRALGTQMKLGCDDVQLAMARVLAGSVQYSLGHFIKALKLFQDALGTLREVGLEQETVAATYFHIGTVQAALCNYDEAMSNLTDALDIQKKLLGTEHPATFRTRREIGNLYVFYDSELESVFEEFQDIIEAQKRMHGERHPCIAETLHSIGCAQARKGDLSVALRTLEDCYNMRLPFLGMDHPQQAATLHEISKIQLKRGRLKKALHIIDAALNIRVESLSEHHIDVALTMATKASCLVAKGNFADANKLFMEALPIAKTAVGESHPSVASIQVQIGVMNLRKCDFESAASAVKNAISIYRQSHLDEDHAGIKEATDELERIERAEMLCV